MFYLNIAAGRPRNLGSLSPVCVYCIRPRPGCQPLLLVSRQISRSIRSAQTIPPNTAKTRSVNHMSCIRLLHCPCHTDSRVAPLWSSVVDLGRNDAACSTSTPPRPAGHSDSRFTNNWYTATPAAITYITPISPSLVNRNKQQSRRRHLHHRIH